MPATKEALIQKTPGVHGGAACIRTTRIPVWVLVGYKQLGLTEERFLKGWPSLNRDDLAAAWDYYSKNQHEIDELIRINESDDEPD